MQNYKELKVWERSHFVTLEIYKITKSFPKEEVYGLSSQMRRAVTSIPANIAEGCGRFTKPDFANFLQIALGSANETEYYLLLAKDLNYLDSIIFTELSNLVNQIKAMLIGLIKKVRIK